MPAETQLAMAVASAPGIAVDAVHHALHHLAADGGTRGSLSLSFGRCGIYSIPCGGGQFWRRACGAVHGALHHHLPGLRHGRRPAFCMPVTALCAARFATVGRVEAAPAALFMPSATAFAAPLAASEYWPRRRGGAAHALRCAGCLCSGVCYGRTGFRSPSGPAGHFLRCSAR